MVESFCVVDENDNVIGKASREECHETNKSIHRSVCVLVINDRNEMFLQRRSETKDLYGGYYTGSATGHVDYGEDYETAAQRELLEELGIRAPIKRISKFRSFSNVEREISALYLCRYNGPIKLNEEEISEGFFLSLRQISEDLHTGRRKFAYGFKIAFENFLRRIQECRGDVGQLI